MPILLLLSWKSHFLANDFMSLGLLEFVNNDLLKIL